MALRLSLLATLALLCLPAAAAPRRVVLDPGHGGAQGGAAGPDGFLEKSLSLELARRVKVELERSVGAQVTLTRERDQLLSLPDRVQLANQQKPDVFVSIHANSMPTRRLRERVAGVETFFLSASASGEEASKTAARENGEPVPAAGAAGPDTLSFILADLARSETHSDSSRLAYAVHGQLIQSLHGGDRGVQQAPFYVLTGVEAPAILVEVGFISNPRESARLRSAAYQDRMAAAIAKGIALFLRQREAREL